MNERIFLVGGAVRDGLLGRVAKDKDFVVEAESFEAMERVVLSKGGKIFLSTPEFFTIRAKVPGLGAADFVLARKDGPYVDGRHPESVGIGTIEDDLARRDFTMNAIAQDVESRAITDPHAGQADIAEKLIRCVGDPFKRLNEDRLRIIRALRFTVQLGFAIHGHTAAAIEGIIRVEGDKTFEAISTNRIRDELFKMFSVDTCQSIVWLNHFGLMPLLKLRGIWLKPTVEAI